MPSWASPLRAGPERAQVEQTTFRTCQGPATAPLHFRETWKGSEDPKTEWLPSCLSGRESRAATWRQATQAAAPAAAGTSRLATPLFCLQRDREGAEPECADDGVHATGTTREATPTRGRGFPAAHLADAGLDPLLTPWEELEALRPVMGEGAEALGGR